MSFPEDVPFEVVREKWNTYDIGDGLILKTKVVLLKILKPPEVQIENVSSLVFQSPTLFVIYAPNDKKGTPETREITNELINESIIKDIDPQLIGEENI